MYVLLAVDDCNKSRAQRIGWMLQTAAFSMVQFPHQRFDESCRRSDGSVADQRAFHQVPDVQSTQMFNQHFETAAASKVTMPVDYTACC